VVLPVLGLAVVCYSGLAFASDNLFKDHQKVLAEELIEFDQSAAAPLVKPSDSDSEDSVSPTAHVYEGSASTCQAALQNLAQVTDIDLLNDCMEYYWHHGDEENPPGSYNNTIALGRRWVQVDPQATQTYTVVAWLLWSKWVTWSNHPEQMPDGATKAQEAIDLLLVGRAANSTDGDYHLDCGNTILPLAKFHLPQYYPFVEKSFQLADQYFTDPAKKVRTRLNLGHTYRYENKKAEAIAAYKSVLEIDPNNTVAIRYLKELQ
jgi:tetratricopeptide (TPR) repeat protein